MGRVTDDCAGTGPNVMAKYLANKNTPAHYEDVASYPRDILAKKPRPDAIHPSCLNRRRTANAMALSGESPRNKKIMTIPAS